MNRAPLVGRVFARAKQLRRVDRPRFAVSSDANGSTGALQFRENFVGYDRRISSGGIGAKKCAPHAEIEDDAGCRSQIHIEYRGRGMPIADEPHPQRFALWNGIEPASLTKGVMRKARMDFRQPRERIPSGRFADG